MPYGPPRRNYNIDNQGYVEPTIGPSIEQQAPPPPPPPSAPPAEAPPPGPPSMPPPVVDPVEEAMAAADMLLTAAYGDADAAIARLAQEGINRLNALNAWASQGIAMRTEDMQQYAAESQAALESIAHTAGLGASLEQAGAERELQRSAAQQMFEAKRAALERAGGTIAESYAAQLDRIRAGLPAALAQQKALADTLIRKSGGAGQAGQSGGAGQMIDPELEALAREAKKLELEEAIAARRRSRDRRVIAEQLAGKFGADRYWAAQEAARQFSAVEMAGILASIGEPQSIIIDWLKRFYGLDDKTAQGYLQTSQAK